MKKIIHMWIAVKSLFLFIFSNKYVMVVSDALATLIISIHTADVYWDSKEWVTKLYIYVGISILLNVLFVWADRINKKRNKILKYFSVAYEIQNKLNISTSNKLFRVHKKLKYAIRNRELIKDKINAIADFQTLSFDICKELHNFITTTCNCEDCEVTIFQRFVDSKDRDFVTMIAFKNSQDKPSGTYGEKFYLKGKRKKHPFFIDVFNDNNAEIRVLHKKRAVKRQFDYLDNSVVREEKVCQYIGIPIITNRKKVEILLQIDVSQKRVFGMRKGTVNDFAKNIFLPFANLLYCSYERDLMLNRFYDVLEDNIKNEADT